MTPDSKFTFKIVQIILAVIFLVGTVSAVVAYTTGINYKVEANTEKIQRHENYLDGMRDNITTILNDVKWIKKELGAE